MTFSWLVMWMILRTCLWYANCNLELCLYIGGYARWLMLMMNVLVGEVENVSPCSQTHACCDWWLLSDVLSLKMAVNEIGSELHQTRKMYCAKVKYVVHIRIHILGGHANKKNTNKLQLSGVWKLVIPITQSWFGTDNLVAGQLQHVPLRLYLCWLKHLEVNHKWMPDTVVCALCTAVPLRCCAATWSLGHLRPTCPAVCWSSDWDKTTSWTDVATLFLQWTSWLFLVQILCRLSYI